MPHRSAAIYSIKHKTKPTISYKRYKTAIFHTENTQNHFRPNTNNNSHITHNITMHNVHTKRTLFKHTI